MIALRPAAREDAPAIAAIYAPHVLGGVASFETAAPDADEIARRMVAGDGLYPWLVATRDDRVVAYAYASAFHSREAYRWTVELTIYLDVAVQRQGVGRRLYRALLDTVCEQRFAQAIARIALPNDGSVALHEALGFRQTGLYAGVGWKGDRWVDVGIWQRALAVTAAPPVPPKRFDPTRFVEG